MKRILLVATMASVALASCVKDESVDLTQQAKKLSFEAPVMGTQSRADVTGEIYGTDYPTDEEFAVYAVQHNGDLTTWNAATGFWTNDKATPITVTKEGNGWEEENGTDYYWPKASDENVKLSFAAYSPAELPNGATASYGTAGLTITDFTVNNNVSEQIDLMFSDRTLNQTEADNATDGVSINFNHALSSIVFSAVENDANAGYQITGITIQGDFVTKATFNETVTDGSTYVYNVGGTSNTAVPAWSNPTTTTGQKYTPSFTAYTVTGTTTEFTGGNDAGQAKTAILTIPQTIPNNAKVTITYVYTPNNGVGGTYNKTVNFSEFITTGTPITAWEVGKRYTYLFQFGGTKKIFFAPTVKNWTSVAAGTVEI